MATLVATSTLLPGGAAPHHATWSVPGDRPQLSGCPSTVDDADPLAVAGAAAEWLLCGSGPPGILSPHALAVVAHWSAAEVPAGSAVLTTVVLLDARAAPVVVFAVVGRSLDPLVHRVLVTLFPRLDQTWMVDDVSVLGR